MKTISQGDAQKLLAECMVLRTALEKAEAEIAELKKQDHDFRNGLQNTFYELELRASKAEAELADLKTFIRDVTLFLQKHAHYNMEKIEPMFQRAHRLYVKYDVERKAGGEDA